MERSAGILLAISSLPSKYGIGCFDESAYKFVDWLKKSGQRYWQILPIGPTGYGDSPYQAFSAFAGNPYFINLDEFIKKGWLLQNDCDESDLISNAESVDYAKLYKSRFALLRKAYNNSKLNGLQDFSDFASKNTWLDDYALFMALKDKFDGKPFYEWDDDIRLRRTHAIEKYKSELCDDISFYKFLQYHFFNQWYALKKYANKNGIKIIGDIPIYAAADSADVWANPELYQLDENNIPKAVAGCPPDAFAQDGQLWGNPLYDWKKHSADGFAWWILRLKSCFKLFDVVRIEHFRGFDEYYSIPNGDVDAKNGHWEYGPRMELFKAVEKTIGKREVIAEDLGFVTDSVKRLVKESGFPNMKVLEFAFDSRDTGNREDYLPHNYTENCVAYTGTHDNQTLISWLDTITEEERKAVRDYLCDYHTPQDKLHKPLIALLMRSKARLCIIPMQDWLGLDDKARMNTPSTMGGNWKWRAKTDAFADELASEIAHITKIYGRNC